MERNVTETLGAGATVVLDPNRAARCSTAPSRSRTCTTLEWLAYYIDPPRWPEAVFGAIKPDLAAAGEGDLPTTCAGCHEYGNDQRTPTGLIKLRGMRPEEVGTDATAALRISCPVPDTGALFDPAAVLHRRGLATAEGLRRRQGRHRLSRATPSPGPFRPRWTASSRRPTRAAGIDAAQQRVMEDLDRRGSVTWRDTLLDTKPPYGPYAARPLYGIWAAAPFLHNGSVPTLYDLLLPPERGPRRSRSADASMTR